MAGLTPVKRCLPSRGDDPHQASRPLMTPIVTVSSLAKRGNCSAGRDTKHARRWGQDYMPRFSATFMSADAYHITSTCEDGDGAERSIAQRVCAMAVWAANRYRLHQRSCAHRLWPMVIELRGP